MRHCCRTNSRPRGSLPRLQQQKLDQSARFRPEARRRLLKSAVQMSVSRTEASLDVTKRVALLQSLKVSSRSRPNCRCSRHLPLLSWRLDSRKQGYCFTSTICLTCIRESLRSCFGFIFPGRGLRAPCQVEVAAPGSRVCVQILGAFSLSYGFERFVLPLR